MSKMTNENGENRDKITKRLFEMMQSLQKQQDELNKVIFLPDLKYRIKVRSA